MNNIPEYIQEDILRVFTDVDLSIIKQVLYFDGWVSMEECGGYLVFVGIDDTYQCVNYGYSVFAEDNTNPFLPYEISHERLYEIQNTVWEDDVYC